MQPALFEQAIAFNHSDAHPFRRGNVLAHYAYAIAHQGDFGNARPLAEEALAIGIQEDQPWMQQIALLMLGLLAFQHQDHTAARELFERALAQAKAAAGDKDVTVVGGASVVQECLRRGLADELHTDIMPVLLGEGLRLFDHLSDQAITLEKIKVLETDIRTNLRFRVVK
jgi:riboflavin biosynthesis pyrimidine reductase